MKTTNSEEILGFNPKSTEYKCFMTTVTPELAQYILEEHNADNRQVYASQLVALDKSLDEDGWCNDGGSMSFNTDGNLTEYQHRLLKIVARNLTVEVPTVVGVVPDTFTKTAPAKKRTPVDEMTRKDRTAVKEDEEGLRSFLKWEGRTKLTMKNAIKEWKKLKSVIRKGRSIIESIKTNTDEYKSWGKELLGFASHMVDIGEEKLVKNVLKQLENQVHGEETTLTKEFVKFRDQGAGSPLQITNAEKSTIKFLMLCRAADRLKERPDGRIQFNFTSDKCTHDKMKNIGVYRKFLYNPDNIPSIAHFIND